MGLFQFLEDDDLPLKEISRVLCDTGVLFISLPNIIKLGNLLDPYYFVRVIQFVMAKTTRAPRNKQDEFDVKGNRYFRNKRYYFKQLSKVFTKNRLRVLHYHSSGFGPLTLWRKRCYPKKISLKLNELMSPSGMGEIPRL